MADKNGIFEKVDPGVRIYRSRFNRSFQKLIDVYPGRLYPILADIMMPGDIVKPKLRWNIKVQPSVTPYFTRVKGSVFYFAVPLRQIFGTKYGDGENFIENILTGGSNGDNVDVIPLLSASRYFVDWSGTQGVDVDDTPFNFVPAIYVRYCVTLSNCFGYPTYRVPSGSDINVPLPSIKYPPTVTYHRAYWKIVSDYFVDEDTQPYLVDAVFDGSGKFGSVDDAFFYRDYMPFDTLWSRDYFMSAMKDFLKGTPPAMDLGTVMLPDIPRSTSYFRVGAYGGGPNPEFDVLYTTESGSAHPVSYGLDTPSRGGMVNAAEITAASLFRSQSLPLQGTISVDDMRLAFATQRILERANRCGTRYTEYLLSTFGTAPADGTLQRAWYLGGVRFNVFTPEVLQTSESATTPQGSRAGVGFSVGEQGVRTYHCKEWSVLMAVLNIEPDATYCDGMPRQARYRSRFDFFNPSMQNLSEQVVEKGEIFSDVANTIPSYNPSDGFGYQGMWNELRTKMDEVSGNFRYSELDNWHMALRFTSVPKLSEFFKHISTYDVDIMRPFAVRNMPPFLCSFYHEMTWVRPMVRHPVPGFIDHN